MSDNSKVRNRTPVRHFTDLIVWQKAHILFLELYKKLTLLPRKIEIKTITEQIFRSCGSIRANIAEGFNSRSTKEYIHFLDIAQRSAAETENWIYKIRDCSILQGAIVSQWLETCCEIQKALWGLKKSLEKTKH